jgi:DNA polymerase-3 subunit delta
MPVYFFWGEDDFTMTLAVKKLREDVLDPQWSQFNYDKISGDQPDAIIQALNQAMTPVFGMGGRLVWVVETTLGQQSSDTLLSQLQRTVPSIPGNSHLLLTSRKKPDGRLKSTKLLQERAQIREFSLIPPWKTEELVKQVQHLSQEIGVKLTTSGMQLLAEAVGNNTRQLWTELEKLRLYADSQKNPLDAEAIATLVKVTTQNSLQLAEAIRQGNAAKALGLVSDLVHRNEPALRIVATLVGQFRTWTLVRLMVDGGEKDEKAIAATVEISNPKRVYFLRKEVQSLSSRQLLAALQILLDLEFSLKRGAEPLSTLQTKIVQLCQLF